MGTWGRMHEHEKWAIPKWFPSGKYPYYDIPPGLPLTKSGAALFRCLVYLRKYPQSEVVLSTRSQFGSSSVLFVFVGDIKAYFSDGTVGEISMKFVRLCCFRVVSSAFSRYIREMPIGFQGRIGGQFVTTCWCQVRVIFVVHVTFSYNKWRG